MKYSIEQHLYQVLSPFGCRVFFSSSSVEDLESYDKGLQKKILAAIIKKCKNNPLIIPQGSGLPLHGKLAGFAKIRLVNEGIRIVYRPKQMEDHVRVEIIAIGPRDKNKVYAIAVQRLEEFKKEMPTKL